MNGTYQKEVVSTYPAEETISVIRTCPNRENGGGVEVTVLVNISQYPKGENGAHLHRLYVFILGKPLPIFGEDQTVHIPTSS